MSAVHWSLSIGETLGCMGQNAPLLEKGLAMIHTTNSIIPSFLCTFTFFIPFTLPFFGSVFLIIIPLFGSVFLDHNPPNLTNNIYKSLPRFLLIIISSPNYHYSNYRMKYLIPYINIPHSHPNFIIFSI